MFHFEFEVKCLKWKKMYQTKKKVSFLKKNEVKSSQQNWYILEEDKPQQNQRNASPQ